MTPALILGLAALATLAGYLWWTRPKHRKRTPYWWRFDPYGPARTKARRVWLTALGRDAPVTTKPPPQRRPPSHLMTDDTNDDTRETV